MSVIKMRHNLNTNGLYDLVNYLPNNIEMLEVGSYAGESAKIFLDSGKIKCLYAVDIWSDNLGVFEKIQSGHNFNLVEKSFDDNTKNFNVKKFKMDLDSAMDKIPVVDFAYIDANHDYDFVKSDILNCLKLLKKDGIIAGHDYVKESPGVIKSVNEIFGKPENVFSDGSWLVNLKNFYKNG